MLPTEIDIDKLDKEILSILMLDAKTPYTEIAKKLNVSGGTIHVRMKKLEESGVVKGSNLVIDNALLGYDICAFVGIFLEKGSLYNAVQESLKEIPEVVELHYTTGTYNMFAKIICTDTRNLRDVLNTKLQTINGIDRTETFISLEENIKRQIPVI